MERWGTEDPQPCNVLKKCRILVYFITDEHFHPKVAALDILFFDKNIPYKNIDAEISEILRICQRLFFRIVFLHVEDQ